MSTSAQFTWNGERNRQLGVYRSCPCSICSAGSRGVGYLSFSDASGRGVTVWLENEGVFRRLRDAFRPKSGQSNERLTSAAR